ncbi:unnamed protein product [Microthlaspi erraticum]|uniref:Uncharacterized protein n=1 Tax=Microthlaspi erraticum TaxID=1685480 RepID=A0A6D2HM96_9BRAS|nr:unnamed protein product [Microthlaspi erraticum]
MTSREGTLGPKLDQKAGLKVKSASHIQNISMFLFNSSILLRGLDIRVFDKSNKIAKSIEDIDFVRKEVKPNGSRIVIDDS